MHSRIFELSSEPVPPEKRIGETDIPEFFCDEIADYVCDCTGEARIDSVDWLAGYLGDEVIERIGDDAVRFKPNAKQAYFCKRHSEFCKLARKVSNVSLEEFAGNQSLDFYSDMYSLRKAYDDKYAFYIYDDNEEELYTLDEWIRDMQEPHTVYIGGTVDYHF